MTTANIEKAYISLNASFSSERLEALQALVMAEKAGLIGPYKKNNDVNNHIHTCYSFSPYSPSKAVWLSKIAGLATAGIMDHDSISGAKEFMRAGEITDILTTSGAELRVSFKNTPLKDTRINNPDQSGIAYIAFHAVPECKRDELERFLSKIRQSRAKRNIAMTDKLNNIIYPTGICLSYENDILPLSMAKEGGGVTERHILFALSNALISKYGKGQNLILVINNTFAIEINQKSLDWLYDTQSNSYAYDLLGILKSAFAEKFYIDAAEECPDVYEAVGFSSEIGAVSAYAYLGDVGNSVTGDKKPQLFEDSYLPELFLLLNDIGFNAVTYMPSRNTKEQLNNIRQFCEKYNLLQISGEDINSPRQSFVSHASRAKEFYNLKDAAYAIIGSEKAAKKDAALSMFSKASLESYPDLYSRINHFKSIALKNK